MRTAFINELIERARSHPEIFLVVGDLGFSVIEPFAKEFPDRYLNAGVAEQNMTGVAAGLASEGYHVFTYSIANFPTLRCLEQIRNDICYHGLPVTVVSVGAGMAYGNLGYSHHAVQDIGIMRTLAELTILSPADPGETRECLTWLCENPRPSYLRIGKAGEPNLHQVRGITRGPLPILSGGAEFALVSTGAILKVALGAAEEMKQRGIAVSVYSCPWLQPIPSGFFDPLKRFSRLIVIEEHLLAGGLSSILREHIPSVSISPLALPASSLGEVGSQDFLRQKSGLAVSDLLRAIG
jgi:transketolase